MLQKCEGIVIRSTDYGETNKIVTLYTREWGKVGVMARGAKKPNSRLAAVTQLFTYGQFLFQASTGLGSLQQGEMMSSMRGIREDIFLTAHASYIVDLTDKIIEDKKPNPFLFELLLQTLNFINEGYDLEIITNIYEMKMLNVQGLYPILDKCAYCGSTEGDFNFSIKEGGLLCHRCFAHDPYRIRISPGTVRLLRLFYLLDINRLGDISVKPETKAELKMVINAYYDEHSGLYLKTRKFLDQIDSWRDRL
jgi:DNA repair protein RecO (recombination protein O)